MKKKRKYETPELEVTMFDLDRGIMDETTTNFDGDIYEEGTTAGWSGPDIGPGEVPID